MTDSTFQVANNLTFSTIEAERKRLLNYFRANKGPVLIFDLKEVSVCDSAGLAFLIELKRLARKYKKQSRIENIAMPILGLAEFYGVKHLLDSSFIDSSYSSLRVKA